MEDERCVDGAERVGRGDGDMENEIVGDGSIDDVGKESVGESQAVRSWRA